MDTQWTVVNDSALLLFVNSDKKCGLSAISTIKLKRMTWNNITMKSAVDLSPSPLVFEFNINKEAFSTMSFWRLICLV